MARAEITRTHSLHQLRTCIQFVLACMHLHDLQAIDIFILKHGACTPGVSSGFLQKQMMNVIAVLCLACVALAQKTDHRGVKVKIHTKIQVYI